jgi:hypothetical protein
VTRDEATQVLAILSAAWPNQQVSRETAQLWLGMLAELDQRDAMAAARDAVRQDQWFPTIARFLQLAEARKHGRRNREATERGLPSAHRAAPPNPELMKATRRLIAERQGQHHNHHGPGPCPVCGGVAKRREAGSTRGQR